MVWRRRFRETATLENVLVVQRTIGHQKEFIVDSIHKHRLDRVELGGVQKHATFVCGAVEHLAGALAREQDNVLMVLNDVTDP